MPRQSKATVKPPTIQERDKQLKDMMNEAERQATNPPAPDDGLPTLTDEPTPAETTSTAKPTPPPLRDLREGVIVPRDSMITIQIPSPATVLGTPLVELHLRRVGAFLTDTANTVQIPSPATVREDEHVVVAIYRAPKGKL